VREYYAISIAFEANMLMQSIQNSIVSRRSEVSPFSTQSGGFWTLHLNLTASKVRKVSSFEL